MPRLFFNTSIALISFLVVTLILPSCCRVSSNQNVKISYVSTHGLKKISNDLIKRLKNFYTQNSRYASVEGNARFENVGLDPSAWEDKVFDGVMYEPKGNVLEVHPALGYTFFINEPSGNTRILSHDLRWSLIYYLPDKKWYFHEITPEDIVNIKTLRVKKDSPYNPAEYKK